VPLAVDKRWTLLELLNWTVDYFKRHSVEEPRLNAEMLLSMATGLERVMLYANFEHEPTAEQREEFKRLVALRAQRHPLQYLVGRAEFYGRTFEVTPDVMIPRPETELVVDKCFEKIAGNGEGCVTLDAGTGSGVIAVTLACERPGLRLVATDISRKALDVAAANARKHGVQQRILFLEGDLCEPATEAVELVVSNPPYIPTAVIETLQPEVREHEPRVALDGGPDGLSVIRRLVPQAAQRLKDGGWLVMELGENQARNTRDIIAETDAFDASSMEIQKDSSGCERVVAVRKRVAL
jgi:release factor glutamine methyltransferase